MADNDPQIIGFDISKDLNNLEKLTKYLEKYNIAIKAISDATLTYNEKGKVQTAVIETLDAANRKVVVTLERLLTANGNLKKSLDVTSAKLKETGVEWASYGDEINHVYDLINRRALERVEHSVTAQLEEIQNSRRNSDELVELQAQIAVNFESNRRREVLSAQQAQFDEIQLAEKNAQEMMAINNEITANFENSRRRQVLAAQESEAKIIQRRNEALVSAEQTNQRLLQNDLRTFAASTEAFIEETTRREQLAAAANAGNVARGAFGPIPVTATTDQRLGFATSIAQATSYVANGTITAERFQQLIKGIRTGTIQTFQETELGVARSILRMQDAYKELGSAVQTNNQGILLSWQTMIRILEIQLIHNLFGQILTGLHQGYQDAIKLSIAIGEIRTVSQDAQLSTDEWTKSVRRLSDVYGKDLKDEAEGLYQIISNQVAKGQDAVQLAQTVNKFAITSVSTIADSVNLITAAMNAYNLKVSDAESVSASFFKTIELGRVRANEMANSLGHILPTAAALGISLNEVESAIATLTIQGLKFNEASTLISNVMLRLLKPTDDMKKVFKEWGVSSGEAALAAFGFGGTLNKLSEAAEGSSSELADLFKNLRAIRGAIGLTGTGFETYSSNLKKIQDAEASYNNAFKLVEETPGKRLSDEFQKIRNVFTVDFGTVLVREIVEVSDAIGGLANTLTEITRIGVALGEAFVLFRVGGFLAPGLRILSGAFDLVTFSARNNLTSMEELALAQRAVGRSSAGLLTMIGPQGLIIAGLTAATLIYQSYQREVQRQIDLEETLTTKFKQEEQALLESRNAILNKSLTTLKEYENRLFSTIIQSAAGTSATLDDILEKQQEGIKHSQELLQASTEGFLKGQTDALNKLREQQNHFDSEAKKTQDRLEESKDKLDKAELNKLLDNSGPVEQVEILTKKFKDLQKGIAEAFAQKNPELAIKRYNAAAEIITKIGELQEKFNKGEIKDQQQINKDKQKEQELDLQKQINDLKEGKKQPKGFLAKEIREIEEHLRELKAQNASGNLADNLDKSADAAKKAADAIASIQVNFGKDAVQSLEKFWQDALTKFGSTASDTARKLGEDAAKEEIRLALLRKTLSLIESFDVLKKNGQLKYKTPEEAQTEIDRLIAQAESAGLKRGTDEWTAIWEQRGKIVEEIQTEINVAVAKQQQELFIQQKQQLERLVQDAKDKQAELEKNVLDLDAKRKVSFGLLADGSRLSDLGGQLVTDPVANRISPEEAKKLQNAANALSLAGNDKESLQARITALQQFNKLFIELHQSQNVAVQNALGSMSDQTIKQGNKDVPIIQIIRDVIEETSELSKAQTEQAQGQTLFGKLKDDLFAFSNELAGLPAVVNNSVQSITVTFKALSEQIRALHDDAARLQIDAWNQAQNSGVQPHFASGGGIGTDSIHAMLTPGEFVMNKQAAGSFYPLLSALNATRPQHFNSGGNVSVGNITVNSNMSGNTPIDAVSLGKALRREIQRGALSGI